MISAGQTLTQVDLNGNTRWTYYTTGSLNYCRVGIFQGEETVVCGGFDYTLTYLDPNGKFTLPKKIVKAPVYALEILQSDKLLVGAGKTVMIFEPPQKQATWTKVMPTVIKCAQTSLNSFYIGDLSGMIRKYSLEGELTWEKHLEGSPQTIAVYDPSDADSDLFVGLSNGAILCLSSEGELKWLVIRRWQPISTVTSFQMPGMVARQVLVTTLEGAIILLDETGGLIADLDITGAISSARFNTVGSSEYTFFLGTYQGEILLLKFVHKT
ncbi:MAG: hypothetical protein ACFFCZ_04745 [Promethearchaeota archaeon]